MGDGLVQPHRARGIGAGINESEQLAARHSDQRARRHQPCRLQPRVVVEAPFPSVLLLVLEISAV